MPPLSPELRRKLETTIRDARELAEAGAKAALKQLAVDQAEPFAHLSAEQRELRNRLRVRSRQLGDVRGEKGQQEITRGTMQCAYEYWHRMLFARFLAENHLLMHPEGVAVSLEECAELAAEEKVDAWTLASRYAARMLPQIFRPDDPLLQVEFATEHKLGLEKLLELPSEVFLASDSLGWVYQFWQAKRKEEVNKSGNKIGADELAAVTQLFTEDYMVDFLLHNTLGAWWVTNHPGEELPVEMPYLRFVEEADPQTADEEGEHEETKVSKIPAAGTFPGFPKQAKDLRILDPCCGSGHFLVAEFNLLVPMRMKEEGLSARDACDVVLRDNLYGLELDERCTQIAAFALAMAAWTFPGSGGYRPLPQLNIACSGIAINAKREQWIALAGDDQRLRFGMARLYDLFKDAPTLGSLIDPGADRLALEASFDEVQPLLEKALMRERKQGDYESNELGVAAQGIATAAKILADKYQLVATNVPYLSRSKQNSVLRRFCESRYPESKTDLSTVFVEHCLEMCDVDGCVALVTPQNWLFLDRYKHLRKRLLQQKTWSLIIQLGAAAFQDMNWWAAKTQLLTIQNQQPVQDSFIAGIDISTTRVTAEKADLLKLREVLTISQVAQLDNPDTRIAFHEKVQGSLLEKYAACIQGLATSDDPQFVLMFWELPTLFKGWELLHGTVNSTVPYGARERILHWEDGKGRYYQHAMQLKAVGRLGGWKSGTEARGKFGVSVQQMRDLPCTLYGGDFFNHNGSVIIPHDPNHLPAIWSFCQSPEFNKSVRKIDQSLKVATTTVVKVPFDAEYWKEVAEERYPNGLPKPYSDDPTQWIFKGEIPGSRYPLQVAVARLLGYRWHDQQPDDLDELTDTDGVACLPAVRGEQPASDRLRTLLAKAYGNDWTAQQHKLLAAVSYDGKPLDDWLRNGFFDDHCKRFHQRPFIWHIWDGHKAGFSALVNYHKLDKKLLETLTYTYLGDWLRRQQDDVAQGKSGADAKLLAAQNLQKQLERILEGEAPYDIFVRWKPIKQQPIGWEPDLNDGVRLNIRPFVQANILRKKPSINWNKDRGKNPPGSPWGEDRLNDLHLTLEEKRKAREALQEENQP
jgi:hypothetical protein